MSNYPLVISKVVDLARNKRTFAFSLGTLRSIDPTINSLSEAFNMVRQILADTYSIATIYNPNDQMLVFVAGARTTLDLIPAELVGARYSAPAPVLNNSVFDPSYTPVQPTLSSRVIDTRFCSSPFTNIIQRSVLSYGDGRIMNYAGMGLRHNLAYNSVTRGYIMYPATSDMRPGLNNYTYDLCFGLRQWLGSNTAIAEPLIDTRNQYGEGFVIEALYAQSSLINNGSQSYPNMSLFLRYREGVRQYTIELDVNQVYGNSRADRVTVVKYGSAKYVYFNGVRVFAFSTSENYSATNIYLGAYSPYQPLNTGDGYIRTPVNGIHNLATYFESFSFVKQALFLTNFSIGDFR